MAILNFQQTLPVLHLPHFWTFLPPKLINWNKQLYLGLPSSTYHHHCPIPPTLVNDSQSCPPSHPLKSQSFYNPPSPNLPTLTSFPPPWLNCVLPPFHHSLLIWQIFLSCMVFFHPALRLPRSLHFSKNQNWTQMNFQITGRFPNLNNISKLLERLFLARLQPHLINSPHYNPLQSAYRDWVTLLKLLYSPYLTKLGCQPTVGNPHFSCHLISALPSTPLITQFLLARLRSMYGVDGNALMWLESYLSQRVQYVKFGQDVSSTTQLKTGVPRGFGPWAHPFHFLHLPHSICHQPVQCWSFKQYCGWYPSFHLLIKR